MEIKHLHLSPEEEKQKTHKKKKHKQEKPTTMTLPEYLISAFPGLLKLCPQLLLFAARAYRKKAVTVRVSCCHCSPTFPLCQVMK